MLKIPFSSRHSEGLRCEIPVSFLVAKTTLICYLQGYLYHSPRLNRKFVPRPRLKSWRPLALSRSRSSGSSFHWFFERSSYFPSFFLALSWFFFCAPLPRKKSKEQTNKQKQKKAKQTVNNHVKRWIWVDHESYQGLWGDHFSEMTFKGGLSIFYRGKFNFLWPTPQVKNNDYVTVVAKSAFYHSRNISRIRKYNISFHTAEI